MSCMPTSCSSPLTCSVLSLMTGVTEDRNVWTFVLPPAAVVLGADGPISLDLAFLICNLGFYSPQSEDSCLNYPLVQSLGSQSKEGWGITDRRCRMCFSC